MAKKVTNGNLIGIYINGVFMECKVTGTLTEKFRLPRKTKKKLNKNSWKHNISKSRNWTVNLSNINSKRN